MPYLPERLASALAHKYEVQREIGHGMATVYLARDLKRGRTVAIRVLPQELAQTVGAERLLGEIKIAARFQSPHMSKAPLSEPSSRDGEPNCETLACLDRYLGPVR